MVFAQSGNEFFESESRACFMIPKISICIPTFDRAVFIKELLESIFAQVESESIEVIVSDNASSDNTIEILEFYREKYSNFFYFCSQENVGPDRNFFRCVEFASGEYVWLMGSDDKLNYQAIRKVLVHLESKKDIYLQDRGNYDFNMKYLSHQTWWTAGVKEEWDFSRDSLSDYVNGCVSLGGVFSYLSSVVVNREKWFQNLPPERYFGTAYPHVYTLLSILVNGGSLELIKNSGVMNRCGNDFFVKDGICKRVCIDLHAFSLLSDEFMTPELYQILKKEYGGSNRKRLALIYDGCVDRSIVRSYVKKLNLGTLQEVRLLLSFWVYLIRKRIRSAWQV
jgi:abequosyltransferase